MNQTDTDSPPGERLLALDPAAEALLFTDARTANTFSDEPVSDADAVLAADLDFHEHIPRLLPFRPEMREAFAGDEARRDRHARFNATLQAAYFILAVRAAGLAAGPMAGFDAAGVDAEFFAGSAWRSILVVNIGKPGVDPWFERLPRLDYDDFVAHV